MNPIKSTDLPLTRRNFPDIKVGLWGNSEAIDAKTGDEFLYQLLAKIYWGFSLFKKKHCYVCDSVFVFVCT